MWLIRLDSALVFMPVFLLLVGLLHGALYHAPLTGSAVEQRLRYSAPLAVSTVRWGVGAAGDSASACTATICFQELQQLSVAFHWL